MNGATQRVRGTIGAGHKGAAVEVPFSPATQWGQSAQRAAPGRLGFAVTASSGAVRWDGFIVARSKRFWLLLDDATLQALALRAGDDIDVHVTPRSA